jgi:hypothetical protein
VLSGARARLSRSQPLASRRRKPPWALPPPTGERPRRAQVFGGRDAPPAPFELHGYGFGLQFSPAWSADEGICAPNPSLPNSPGVRNRAWPVSCAPAG